MFMAFKNLMLMENTFRQLLIFASLLLLVLPFSQAQQRDPLKTETGPSWADASGTAIGFSSRRTGHFNLYRKDLKSGEIIQLTADTVDQHYPVWSPDGQWLAYQTKVGDNQEIFLRNLKTNEDINISNHPGPDGDDYPAWSPDSKQLYFTSRRDGQANIFRKTIGQPGVEQVTNNPVYEMNPQVSPDGKLLAFTAGEIRDFHIYTMSLDGSNRRQVTDSEFQEMFPTWHPDGKSLFFQRRTAMRQSDIFSIALDGTGEKQLSNSDGLKFYPRISPDGRQILFMSGADGDPDIYMMEVASGKVVQLTDEEGN